MEIVRRWCIKKMKSIVETAVEKFIKIRMTYFQLFNAKLPVFHYSSRRQRFSKAFTNIIIHVHERYGFMKTHSAYTKLYYKQFKLLCIATKLQKIKIFMIKWTRNSNEPTHRHLRLARQTLRFECQMSPESIIESATPLFILTANNSLQCTCK